MNLYYLITYFNHIYLQYSIPYSDSGKNTLDFTYFWNSSDSDSHVSLFFHLVTLISLCWPVEICYCLSFYYACEVIWDLVIMTTHTYSKNCVMCCYYMANATVMPEGWDSSLPNNSQTGILLFPISNNLHPQFTDSVGELSEIRKDSQVPQIIQKNMSITLYLFW